MKKKKRLSNMLKMKQPVHIKSNTINTEINTTIEQPKRNFKQLMETIDPHKIE